MKYFPMKLNAVLLAVALAIPVKAAENLWTQRFKADSGFPTSLSQIGTNSEETKATLVLFWASWCLPCKEELANFTKHPPEAKGLRIVAVSVDDASGAALAQTILADIHWPFFSLFDEAGQFFFNFNQSGQLPFSALLDSQGNILRNFQKLGDPELKEISDLVLSQKSGGRREVQFSYGVQGEAVDFSGDNSLRRQVSEMTGFARVDGESVSAQVQYDWVYLHDQNPASTVKGDEIGFSYLEYRSALMDSHQSLRLGDNHMALLQGELLDLQNTPGLPNPASLRGATLGWDFDHVSILAFGGEIHPALFATPINPTTDVALPSASESAEGAGIYWHDEDGKNKKQFSFESVFYHRGINSDLGFLEPVSNQRWGTKYYFGSPDHGISVQYAGFGNNTGVAGYDADHPYIFDPLFWWSIDSWQHCLMSLHYIEYESLPARTLTPVLVEDPALPLEVAKLQSVRFSPKFSDDLQSWWFEPIWVWEESINLVPFERQNSFGFNLSFPKRDQKLIGFVQLGRLSDTSTYQEESLLLTSPVAGPISTQVRLRKHLAAQLAGDSDGLNFGFDLNSIFGWTDNHSQWHYVAQWTRQSGYYFGFSGLSRTDLFSSHLEWVSGVNSVKLGIGAEPGGLVCTNGICIQRPPLNGADIALAVNF